MTRVVDIRLRFPHPQGGSPVNQLVSEPRTVPGGLYCPAFFVVTRPLLAFYEAKGDIFADELRPRVALFRPSLSTFSFGFHLPSFGAFFWIGRLVVRAIV